jgi:hypothetical protein
MSREWLDPNTGLYFVNETDIPDHVVGQALAEQHPGIDAIARAISSNLAPQNRGGNIFQRDRYVTPERIADQMRLASHAAKYDDVVAGVLETTEAMAFSRVTFECADLDEQDIWNQMAEDLNLDRLLRQMWRESFTVSQFYAAVWTKRKSYKVRGKGEKRARRKEYKVVAPDAVTILDPIKVVPVGNFVLGRENLAYCADRVEATNYDDVLAGDTSSDLVVKTLFKGRYEATRPEKQLISELGFDADNLFLLNPEIVHRHTDTRATYERFADIRMASIFELLDLKNLLRALDRSMLLGGINYIVLVRIGTDEKPAKQAEVNAMTARVQQGSRLPVLIGDHRLTVDIVSPGNTDTLRPERYNTIDSRITARLYSLMNTGGYEAGKSGDKSLELSRIIGRVLESRRQMLRRFVEKTIVKPTFDRNEEFTEMPKLRFAPKRIALSLDPATMQALLDLRDRRELSRSTMLGEMDFSQEDEARKLEMEKELYDDIFETKVPYSAAPAPGQPPQPGQQPQQPQPDATDPRTGGRNSGGRRNGGGRPPGSGDRTVEKPK